VPPGLEWVRVSYDSVHGGIASHWRQTSAGAGTKFTWTVTIPANTSATVFVPARDAAAVRESGHPAAQAPGLKLLRQETPFAVFEAGSGTYQFESGR
jgi:alpha-L-rhamnosidase